jgi:hypothetical protein
VVSDWKAPDIASRDNWRKELFDATRFAPDRGAGVLWDWSRLPEVVCTPGTVWALASAEHRARLAAVPGLALVQAQRGVELWRAAGQPCAAGVAQ